MKIKKMMIATLTTCLLLALFPSTGMMALEVGYSPHWLPGAWDSFHFFDGTQGESVTVEASNDSLGFNVDYNLGQTIPSGGTLSCNIYFSKPGTTTVTGTAGGQSHTGGLITVYGIIDFAIPGQVGATAIDHGSGDRFNRTNGSIALTMPHGTDLSSLTPSIASVGTVSPNGIPQDFSNGPVTYTMTNGIATYPDWRSIEYHVTVSVESAPPNPPVPPNPQPAAQPRAVTQQERATPEPPTGQPAIIGNTSKAVPVYEKAKPDSKVIGKAQPGEDILLQQWNFNETFCRVLYNNNNNAGWIEGKYIIP